MTDQPRPDAGRGLLVQIAVGVVAGIVVGGFWPAAAQHFELVGDVFLNLLMMLVVPLVILSMVGGIAGLGDVRRVGAIGWRTLAYYLLTTAIAVVIGLVAVNTMRPGDGLSAPVAAQVAGDVDASAPAPKPGGDAAQGAEDGPAPQDDAADRPTGPVAVAREILLGDPATGRQGLVPRNPFAAMARFEILPLIVFSLLLGAALSTLGERARATLRAIETLEAAVIKLVEWVLRVAPIGIFGLIAARIGHAGGFTGFWPELVALGMYTATVLVGLAIHGIVVLPLVLWLVGRRRPGPYVRGMAPALLSAASTSSSSATLPLTLDGVQRKNGVRPRTASFVLPLGATINMDGTALYEAVAALFIAQVYGIELDATRQAIVVLTATLAAIGAAGIPEAGLITMLVVLRAAGLPVEGVGLLLAVDWLLDRARTTVNVWGDSVGAAVVDRLLPEDAPCGHEDAPANSPDEPDPSLRKQ